MTGPPQPGAAPSAPSAAPAAGARGLSEEMRRVIYGEVSAEEKDKAYQGSLQRWWQEYAGRKNEEEDMVADSLLYDERCHLPRTTAGPRFDSEPPAQPQPQQQQQQQPPPAEANGAAKAAANGAANGRTAA